MTGLISFLLLGLFFWAIFKLTGWELHEMRPSVRAANRQRWANFGKRHFGGS